MNYSLALIAGLFALNTSATPCAQTFEQKCQSFSQRLSNSVLGVNASVQPTQFVKAGTTLNFPNVPADCSRPSQLASIDLCRVALNVTTSASSSIRMEAWLPLNWTGRFLSTGNGGLGGCIQYEDIEYAASLGFATVGANNGHDGTTGISFYKAPEVIADYAYRSVHTGVVVGKKISAAFYGKPHTKSYYLGCSTGGRQGWKSVQDYPKDFDGVVAGAPAFAFNNLTSWSSGFYPITGPNTTERFVSFPLWQVIHQDVLAQCDELDGVKDGVIEDPDLCIYDPSRIACSKPGANATACLTTPQIALVREILSAKIDPTDGSLVYPRFQPGAEIVGALAMFNGRPFGASDWFKYAIIANPNWDPLTLNPTDWHASQDRNLANVQTWNGDISRFRAAGGKVLHYHGLMDGIISSENSPRYYSHVSKTMNLTPKELDEFYRYFRISGLAHCSGGDGAGFIGNQKRNSASLAPEENVLLAMVKWVEEGVAPEIVRGTRYVNGNATAGVVDYKRNHCKWPKRTKYKGGDPKALGSWECVEEQNGASCDAK